jgi:hypothetical protein
MEMRTSLPLAIFAKPKISRRQRSLSLHSGNSSGYNSENQLLGGSALVLAGATGGFACF